MYRNQRRYNQTTEEDSLPKSFYDTEPIITTQPYEIGTLNQDYLNSALDYLNFYRFLAGLPADLTLDEELNDLAQQGAVLLDIINDGLTHYPEKPAGMDQDFYSKGKLATASSNLALGCSDLRSAISGYMIEYGDHNLSEIGHRRWILNPPLKTVGFGQSGKYSSLYIIDKSRSYPVEYDAIVYPAASSFPNNLFKSTHIWSISLNKDKFSYSASSLRITLEEVLSGKTWEFYEGSSNYFTVSTKKTGSGPCIIFRPNDIASYVGLYNISVEGVTDRQGNPMKLKYSTNFFDMTDSVQWITPDTTENILETLILNNQELVNLSSAFTYGITSDSLKKLGSTPLTFDSLVGESLQVQLTIDDPSQLSRDLKLSGYVRGSTVDDIKTYIKKFFSNKRFEVIHFAQKGTWGTQVQVKAKSLFSPSDKLTFYSFDTITKNYYKIDVTTYNIDENGFLNFKTAFAGDILITRGILSIRDLNELSNDLLSNTQKLIEIHR
jgi:uncharacterized protein YkwD